ncbi:hypothetical protein SAMN05421505_10459 [Sinosporangium album]|uniref:Uncharacterized protein n=1 Tax=Sinosporangium album TaxID=504805 RepID=A0A1G7U299_9ACTN|nr:hypothetical protein [Sinosporangium album]SDG41557.1 hypothetical protein SAMN05421505_10459 [Sinosporangium album]
MDVCPADLSIGFPRESGIERRTILTPAVGLTHPLGWTTVAAA